MVDPVPPSTPANDGSSGARQVSPSFVDAVEDAGGGRGGLGTAGPNSSSASSAVAGETALGIGDVLKTGIVIRAGSDPAVRTKSGFSPAQVEGFIQRAVEAEKDQHRVKLAEKDEEHEQEKMQLNAARGDLILRTQFLYILCFVLFEVIVCSAFGLHAVSMVGY